MLIRNLKSKQEEQSQRNLANELLQVEINNADIIGKRIAGYTDKNAPPAVPQQYKTDTEIRTDTIKQEKEAIDNLISLGYDYSKASQIVIHLGSKRKLVDFNASFPHLKADILKKYNPRYLSVSFIQNYLDTYFDNLDVSFGHKFSGDTIQINSIQELQQYIPTQDALLSLIQAVKMYVVPVAKQNGALLIDVLTRLTQVLPTHQDIVQLGVLAQVDRARILRRLAVAIEKNGLPTYEEIRRYTQDLDNAVDEDDILAVTESLTARLGNMGRRNLETFLEARKDIQGDLKIDKDIIDKNLQEVKNIPIKISDMSVDLQQVLDLDMDVDSKKEIIRQIIDNTDETQLGILEEQVSEKLPGYLEKAVENGVLEPDGDEYTMNYISGNEQSLGVFKDRLFTTISELIDWGQENPNLMYFPNQHLYYEDPDDPQIGFGVRRTKGRGSKVNKALTNHFIADQKFLKKTAKAVTKMRKKIQEDSSSDEETMKTLTRHKKAEEPMGKAISKAVVGEGYIHKRIPVKKIVGKGIEVEEQPTYKTFGKYVMHIPHLLNNGVLNLKYPSLGSIPSIKPMTISDNYKEFVIDVMNSGKINEKHYEMLAPHEKKHFERITKGAGLIDTFKIKRTGDDEEKEEADRFNLLRGNYLGGNNSPDVVKELKALVVKFMTDGRIHRNEGLNLLMELSVI
jgi:hypothetical protein